MENRKRIIQLANMEDMTAYQMGEYVHGTTNSYVYFGRDNDYPNYLRSLYLNSPTFQAIVDSTINLATGEGVEVVDPLKNPVSNKWLNENFPKEVIKSLISDLKTYGYAVVEIYGGNLIKYVESMKYRFDAMDEFGQINYMWYSADWQYYSYKKNQPKKVPIYKDGCTDDVQVAYITLDRHGYDYYAPVDYNGSINYISLETEISKYHLSNIKNGLFPSFLINFVGTDFSDQMMDQIERDVNAKFGGSSNTGRAIISFSDTKDNATVLQTVEQSQLSETYTFLSKECSEKIMIGNGVTSGLLMGIRDLGGGFGSNADELEKSFYLYYESKLKHYQNYVLQLIKQVMEGNLLFGEVRFITYNPFAVTTNTQKMSKIETLNEVNSQDLLNKIDNLKVKSTDIVVNERLLDKLNDNKLYKFIKSSTNNNMIIKKFEILSDQGYLFKADEIIKNTKDYFFYEVSHMKKN